MAEEPGQKRAGDEAGAASTRPPLGIPFASVISSIALLFSGYSLWSTTLRRPELAAFVPPVIEYSSPYQNSNFEMIAVPVTLSNEGARTGVVLSMEIAVTDPRSGAVKRFYAADLGRWSMERTKANAYQPFAPLSLAGRSTRTETVLFYTRGEEEKPAQIIREVGDYKFKLTMEQAIVDELPLFDALWRRAAPSVEFERELKYYDARAFNNGTLRLFAKDWRSSVTR